MYLRQKLFRVLEGFDDSGGDIFIAWRAEFGSVDSGDVTILSGIHSHRTGRLIAILSVSSHVVGGESVVVIPAERIIASESIDVEWIRRQVQAIESRQFER